jgi:predicted phosphodiesterase
MEQSKMKLGKIKKTVVKKLRSRIYAKLKRRGLAVNKIAFISDIHGNLEALLAVITDIVKEDIDKVICVGDVIGYGPNPNECLQLIKELKIDCVRGNHEDALVQNQCFFSDIALKSIRWTAGVLSEQSDSFIKSFPYILKYEIGERSFTVVHGSNDEPEKFKYIDNSFLADRSIYKQKLCFTGHSHYPLLYFTGKYLGQKRTFLDASNITAMMKKSMNCIVNVGSVGQPRDKDTRACYSIYDLNENKITWRRVEYDIKKTQNKIRKSGLPDFCATRLSIGD